MTTERDRWVCPVCDQRFLYLSELVDHVESRHPADNVTILEPSRPLSEPDEEDREAAENEGPGVQVSAGEAPAPNGGSVSDLEPFAGSDAAVRAVMEWIAGGPRRELPSLLLRLLGTVLRAEARAVGPGEEEGAGEGQGEPLVDPRTGLGNRRVWIDLLASEEDRCRRYGAGASVVLLRLEGRIDDDLLRRAASVVARQTRAHDTVVRLRDDALGVLAVRCPEEVGDLVAERMLEAMRAERIPVRVAVGSRGHRLDLYGAWDEAERRLGEDPPPGSAYG